jgi:hypothetical protein
MNIFKRVWSASMAATRAFREEFTNTNLLGNNIFSQDFSTWEGRKLRYAILWAMYENTAYRNMHVWAQSYKTTFGLYRWIRNIESPTSRLGDFWQAHIWGGLLDPNAGDGKEKPSALPIATATEDKQLRAAIAKLWDWSNWQVTKDVVTLRGTVLGDTFIKVVDDAKRSKVYLSALHPASVRDLSIDQWGNVKEYVLEEMRPDPDSGRPVLYREEATRDGINVQYRTYRNGAPFAWNEKAADWQEPYGFIPLVFIQHRNVGLNWGWSEMHNGLPLFREVDDQSSLLNDQIRKMVNAPYFFAGVSAPSANANGGVQVSKSTSTDNNPQAGREDMPALYGPSGATATPLIAPLDITATAARIENLVSKIERDFPELSDNLENAAGDVSGRALRINRQPVIDKVNQRRPSYDSALVRAQQMAIAIGGFRNYDQAFSGYDLNSFKAGKLDHIIAERPVFAKDPLDDLEVETSFWTAAGLATKAGVPLSVFLRRNGWTESQIKDYENSPENQSRMEALNAATQASKNLSMGDMSSMMNNSNNNNVNQQ